MASWKNATGRADPSPRPARRAAPGRDRAGGEPAPRPPGRDRCGPSSSGTGRCGGTCTGRVPFRSEVLSHPSVNVSVESGTASALRPRAARRPAARRRHPPLHRRPGRRRSGDRGEVPARRLRRAHRRAAGAQRRRRCLGRGARADRRALLDAVLAEDDDDGRAAVLDAALAPLAPDPPAPYLDLLELLGAHGRPTAALVRVDQVAAARRG